MNTLQSDDQGQMAQGAVALVIALLMIGLMGSLLLPIGLDAITSDTEQTITQNTSETVEVNPELDATLDSVTDGTSATYTLNQSDGGEITKTVNLGANETFSFARGDVTVNLSSTTTDSATSTFAAPPEFSFGDGARAMWGILDVIIVLGLFLFLIGIAVAGVSRNV